MAKTLKTSTFGDYRGQPTEVNVTIYQPEPDADSDRDITVQVTYGNPTLNAASQRFDIDVWGVGGAKVEDFFDVVSDLITSLSVNATVSA